MNGLLPPYLDRITVHRCGGASTDVIVGATLDPVLPTTFQIPAGKHCALTFHWDTVLEVDGPAYTVLLDEQHHRAPRRGHRARGRQVRGSRRRQ